VRGLGRRQRAMLVAMAVHGGGGWPERWHLRSDDAAVLVCLARKGLVTGRGRDAALTGEGRDAASALRGQPVALTL